MLISAIIWILLGSGCLLVVLLDVIVMAWVFSLVKKMVWGRRDSREVSRQP